MKAHHYTRYFTVIIVASLLAACSATSSEDDKKARLEKLKAEQADLTKQIQQLEKEIAVENPNESNVKLKEVAVKEVAPSKFEHYIQTQGQVEAEDNVMVSAKTMGVVTRVFVTEGQQVSKGQTLAQIDNSLISQGIEELKSQLELAKTVYERQKNLWDQKIGTEVQYLQAKTNKESLENRLASMYEQNEMSKIKSPINGTVDAIQVKVGENIAPGMPAVRVVNTSNLKVTATISEAFISMINKNNTAHVSIPDINKEFDAKVTFVGKTIDPLSRSFSVEVKLPASKELRPNMTAVLKIVYHAENSAIVVPVNIIQEVNNEKIVYVAEKEGNQLVARKKVVTVDGVFDAQAQVKGLDVKDKIITVGYQGLNDGEAIKI